MFRHRQRPAEKQQLKLAVRSGLRNTGMQGTARTDKVGSGQAIQGPVWGRFDFTLNEIQTDINSQMNKKSNVCHEFKILNKPLFK